MVWIYDNLGWLFCEVAFKLWNVLDWYWNKYRVGEEYDMGCWQQKFCEWFYDKGCAFYQKASDLMDNK